MSREWKPGDVAEVTLTDGTKVLAFYTMRGQWPWVTVATANYETGIAARPLVVIDPEDREKVERLTGLIYDAATDRPYVGGAADGVQHALRSLVADPKPDEPQGLGAVVEDDRGVRWVRSESAKGIRNPWMATLSPQEPDEIRQLNYVDVHAVRVLSEGWSE